MKKSRLAGATLGSLLLVACGSPGKPATQIAQRSVSSIGCKVSQSEMWNALHQVAEEGGNYPAAEELRSALLEHGQSRELSGKAYERYVDAFVKNYQVTIEGIQDKFDPRNLSEWQKALAEMEVGVKVTEIHAELHGKIDRSLITLSLAEKELQMECPVDEPAAPPPQPIATPDDHVDTLWEQLTQTQNPEVVGARKTLATIYQSCDAVRAPAMTASTPDVKGITILAESHPAGGRKRVYGSLANINASHYYIHNRQLAKNGCFEVRNAPAIYDFGGKPHTTSSAPYNLNMFKDGGSGTSVLGIDCSGYVFSALALAGLKTDPDPKKVLEAKLVHGIPSTAFKEPQSNGLRCLDKIKVSKDKSIEAGDISAIRGHVVLIDEVGDDPFGLDAITSSSDCNSSKISYTKFDFVIAQSSPSKGGIGVNRYQARNYLAESSTFRTGLTRYAVAACRAKFGLSATVDTASLSVVRHKRTPECLAPAKLTSTNEQCVDSCRPL